MIAATASVVAALAAIGGIWLTLHEAQRSRRDEMERRLVVQRLGSDSAAVLLHIAFDPPTRSDDYSLEAEIRHPKDASFCLERAEGPAYNPGGTALTPAGRKITLRLLHHLGSKSWPQARLVVLGMGGGGAIVLRIHASSSRRALMTKTIAITPAA